MRCVLLILLLFLWCVDSPVSADIYKYVDNHGVTCYTDSSFGKKPGTLKKEDHYQPSSKPYSANTNNLNNTDYHSIVHEKASQYDLDPSLIKAVIKTESNWNHRAVSRKGAMGLMQLMPSTANDMNVYNPFNPEENIEGGTKYLRYLLERFKGDLTLALAAYNAGPKTVEKFGCIPPITETRQYVNKVLSLYNGKKTIPVKESLSDNKPEPIYKIIQDDGTILFTNSALLSKKPIRF